MEKKIRSFIAIPLTSPLQQAAASIQELLKPELPSVRWSRQESMHLTLHFFGDIGDDDLEKAAAVMVSIESLFAPFPLALCGLGAFPGPNRARVFWLGVQSEHLVGLYSALCKKLSAAGFPCEQRPFQPHLTIGRSRGTPQKAGHILSQLATTVAGEMTVDRLVLFESELLPTGARHRPRQTIFFRAD
ncbi:MAG: RNA 2',3'-cyclic phosphodiesterase [Desulfuromonas sp.]|mgnify:FL=1|nr:MAG: RNA 2',3'-cyclic phosphodiesterase [Desulfuromonas sp.]